MPTTTHGWAADATWSAEANPRGLDVNVRSAPQMREYAAIADRIAGDRPGRVLDWGCGFGQMSDLLSRRGVDVEPYDVDTRAAQPERRPLERYPGLSALVSSEPVRLPYNDASFGAVLSCGVLEHVPDPGASLDELARVLEPDGTLYVYKLPNRLSYLERIAKGLGLYYHGKLEHDRLYTPSTARALLECHGYRVLEVRRANMLPLSLSHRAVTRAATRVWQLNRALARVPVLNALATNVEVVAKAPRGAFRRPTVLP
jgi:ubiquinone/menaquinone biosynthesis C-methylase UbiE